MRDACCTILYPTSLLVETCTDSMLYLVLWISLHLWTPLFIGICTTTFIHIDSSQFSSNSDGSVQLWEVEDRRRFRCLMDWFTVLFCLVLRSTNLFLPCSSQYELILSECSSCSQVKCGAEYPDKATQKLWQWQCSRAGGKTEAGRERRCVFFLGGEVQYWGATFRLSAVCTYLSNPLR